VGAEVAEVAIQAVAVVGAVAVIQVAAVAVSAFTPGVQRPTSGVERKSAAARARSGALLPLRILPGLPRGADSNLAPRRLRISQALHPAVEFMPAAPQFSLA
jgi:hypothetical protein